MIVAVAMPIIPRVCSGGAAMAARMIRVAAVWLLSILLLAATLRFDSDTISVLKCTSCNYYADAFAVKNGGGGRLSPTFRRATKIHSVARGLEKTQFTLHSSYGNNGRVNNNNNHVNHNTHSGHHASNILDAAEVKRHMPVSAVFRHYLQLQHQQQQSGRENNNNFPIITNFEEVGGNGHKYRCSCPFHGVDKTPSMHINDEKGIFHCFSCGISGDSISFVEKFEGVTFVEALNKLRQLISAGDSRLSHDLAATSRGLDEQPVPHQPLQPAIVPAMRQPTYKQTQPQPQRSQLTTGHRSTGDPAKNARTLKILAKAAQFYHSHLVSDPTAAFALEYLKVSAVCECKLHLLIIFSYLLLLI
jgi:hypothetical protein